MKAWKGGRVPWERVCLRHTWFPVERVPVSGSVCVFTECVTAEGTLELSHGPFPHLSSLLPCGSETPPDLPPFFSVLCHPSILLWHSPSQHVGDVYPHFPSPGPAVIPVSFSPSSSPSALLFTHHLSSLTHLCCDHFVNWSVASLLSLHHEGDNDDNGGEYSDLSHQDARRLRSLYPLNGCSKNAWAIFIWEWHNWCEFHTKSMLHFIKTHHCCLCHTQYGWGFSFFFFSFFLFPCGRTVHPIWN